MTAAKLARGNSKGDLKRQSPLLNVKDLAASAPVPETASTPTPFSGIRRFLRLRRMGRTAIARALAVGANQDEKLDTSIRRRADTTMTGFPAGASIWVPTV